MTQALTKTDRYRADFLALEERSEAQTPPWLRQLRQEAWSRFAALGFPTARHGNEKWKYTNVAPIAQASFRHPLDPDLAQVRADALRRSAPWDAGWATLVFVDGAYAPALSALSAWAEGVRVTSLAQALATDPDLARRHLAQYATFQEDGFIALNTAFLRDGAFVHVPDGASLQSPVHLLFVTTQQREPAVSHPRALVVAGARSRLTIIESYVSLAQGSSFTNAVTEIVLGDGAEVEHYRLLQESPEAFHVGATRVHQSQDTTFSSTSFARGAALARQDIYALLDGPGGSCTLNGLYSTTGREHIDNNINIDHAKPRAKSRLYYKGILDGQSRAIFGGMVLVRRDAQKTDAYQKDKNLILSDEAEVDSKPSLMIYADDVKCGHGATAGHMDEDTMFYMRSRGLDLETTRAMLIHAFASEIIETVRLEPFRRYLDRVFLGSLPAFSSGKQP